MNCEEIDQDIEYDYCHRIAQKIEAGMFARYDSFIVSLFFFNQIYKQSKDYGVKYRQLKAALKNDDNYELRYKLLTEKQDPTTLVDKSSNELAPKKLQELQQQQIQKFFKE